MGRPAELVDHLHPVQPIARLRQDFGIAGKGGRVARHSGNDGYFRLGQGVALRLGPGAGRVDDDSVIALELVRFQRAAVQVADVIGHALDAFGHAKAFVQRGQHGNIPLNRVNFGVLGQRQAESADTREQVDDTAGGANGGFHTGQKGCFAFGRGLQKGPDGQRHIGAAKAHHGLGALGDDLAVPA